MSGQFPIRRARAMKAQKISIHGIGERQMGLDSITVNGTSMILGGGFLRGSMFMGPEITTTRGLA